MKTVKKFTAPLIFSSILSFIFPPLTLAQCPVCAVAVAGGLGISRLLGIDDVIVSLWLGAFLLSSSLWLINYLIKKGVKINKLWIKTLIIISSYLIFYLTASQTSIIGHPLNRIYGVDKVVFGVVLGSVVLVLANWADKQARKLHGKQFVNYQKTIFPVTALLLTSMVFYFLLNSH